MADVTLRLIIYRLGEGYKNMEEKWSQFLEWYSEFSWRRVDVLDMLFLGWLLAAFLVVGAINLYLRFFGLPRYRKGGVLNGIVSRGLGGAPALRGGETCNWINSALSWLYLHYNSTPELVEAWLKALNDEARKHIQQGEFQLRFDRIQAGSLPPKLQQVALDTSTNETLTIRANVETTDTTFLVSTIHQTATNIKVVPCDVNLQRLQGQLKVHSHYNSMSEEILVELQFASPPELKLQVKPRNYENNIDPSFVERVVRGALCGAVTNVSIPSRGGIPHCYPSSGKTDHISPTSTKTYSSETPYSETSGAMSGSHSMAGRRLLVKVIKANGLGDRDLESHKGHFMHKKVSKGCTDPYCIVTLDEPAQKHTTSVVKNTVNPFWDEHFLLDIEDYSRQIKLEVYDREKAPGEDFLGRAVISVDELKRMPSSRQIIPLTGRPHAPTNTSGSITIEFLFMDGDSASTSGRLDDSLSPRRRVETNRQVMPGGTVVTTTTTTTEKQRDQRLDPYYHDSPNKVEKSQYADQSQYPAGSQLGAHDAALTASQVSGTSNRPLGASPKVTVSHPDNTRGYGTMQMSETTPGDKDYHRDTHSLSTNASTDPRGHVEESLADLLKKKHEKDKQKKGFASAIKRRFGRNKKPRSHSADRAQSASYRDGSLLKPPDHQDVNHGTRTAEDLDHAYFQDGQMNRPRSSSFSSSLKRLFGKKPRDGTSREGSVSRMDGRVDVGRTDGRFDGRMGTDGRVEGRMGMGGHGDERMYLDGRDDGRYGTVGRADEQMYQSNMPTSISGTMQGKDTYPQSQQKYKQNPDLTRSQRATTPVSGVHNFW